MVMGQRWLRYDVHPCAAGHAFDCPIGIVPLPRRNERGRQLREWRYQIQPVIDPASACVAPNDGPFADDGMRGRVCLRVLAAVGLVPVRPGGSIARRFARRAHEKGHIDLGNRKARRIDGSRERRGPDPPQEPSSKFQPVKPQCRLRPAWKNRSRCDGSSLDQPSRVFATRSMRRISRSQKAD
ncbi:hypothetical protein ACVWWO_007331 [Bradyrhizobium sp. F1.13.1]